MKSNLITSLVQKRLNDIPHTLLLFMQIIVGTMAGTLGLIMAAPLLVIEMVLVRTLYQEDMLGDKSTE